MEPNSNPYEPPRRSVGKSRVITSIQFLFGIAATLLVDGIIVPNSSRFGGLTSVEKGVLVVVNVGFLVYTGLICYWRLEKRK